MTGPVVAARLAGPWRAPTRVLVGVDLAGALTPALDALDGRPLVVVDAVAAAANPAVAAHLASAASGAAGVTTVVPGGPPTLSEVHDLHRRLVDAGCDVVVAIGGGAVVDLAKAAAACCVEPALVDPRRWRHPAGVVRGCGHGPERPVVVVVPTTFWTGAEVSPVAVLRGGAGGGKRVVVSPSLLPDLAVLDGACFASLPGAAARGGAVEVVARLVVPLVSRPTLADELDGPALGAAAAAITGAERLVRGDGAPHLRLALAVLGADDKARLSGAGRDPWANTAWYLAAAVEDLAGCTKQDALGAVLPAHLAVAALGQGRAGALPFRPASAACLERALGLVGRRSDPGGALAAHLGGLLGDLGVDGRGLGLHPDDAPLLLARARARWAPALAGIHDDVLLDVLRRAASPTSTSAPTPDPGGHR